MMICAGSAFSWPEKGIDRYSEELLSIDGPAALQDIFEDR